MDLIIIGLAAGVASALTLFSGFGLGTVLMPVFALFFPAPLAVAATAVVHFANNLFKFGLMFGQTDWRVVARFGVPAALAAFIGASLRPGSTACRPGSSINWPARRMKSRQSRPRSGC